MQLSLNHLISSYTDKAYILYHLIVQSTAKDEDYWAHFRRKIMPVSLIFRHKHGGEFVLVSSEGQGDERVVLVFLYSALITPRGDGHRRFISATH